MFSYSKHLLKTESEIKFTSKEKQNLKINTLDFVMSFFDLYVFMYQGNMTRGTLIMSSRQCNRTPLFGRGVCVPTIYDCIQCTSPRAAVPFVHEREHASSCALSPFSKLPSVFFFLGLHCAWSWLV